MNVLDYIQPSVGDAVTDAELLPIGTVLRTVSSNRPQITKSADGWFDVSGYYESARTNLTNSIRNSPGHFIITSLPTSPPLTLRQYQAFWRNGVMAGSDVSGGTGRTDIERACERFGLNEETLPFGTGQRINSTTLRNMLPGASTVICGNPANWETFGLWENSGQWRKLLGGINSREPVGPCLVDRVAGERVRPNWMDAEPGEQDATEIILFKAKAWAAAAAAKRHNRWCETLESIMSSVGITEAIVAQAAALIPGYVGVGAVLADTAQIAALPVGSVVMWEHSEGGDRWAYFERVPASTNDAGLRLLFGHRDDGMELRHYARRVTTIAIPDGEEAITPWRMSFRQRGQYLPTGTVIEQSGQQFVRCEDGRFTATNRVEGYDTSRRPGEHAIDAFGASASRTVSVCWVPGSPMEPRR